MTWMLCKHFENFLNLETNLIDSEKFNEIIYTANLGNEDKIYLYKTRNPSDLIKSMTAFYNVKLNVNLVLLS